MAKKKRTPEEVVETIADDMLDSDDIDMDETLEDSEVEPVETDEDTGFFGYGIFTNKNFYNLFLLVLAVAAIICLCNGRDNSVCNTVNSGVESVGNWFNDKMMDTSSMEIEAPAVPLSETSQ